jgi:gluconate 2-dehydrogenase gamma chain
MMPREEMRRREFVGMLGGAAVATWLSAGWSELHAASRAAAASAPQEPWLVLTAQQVTELDAITAQLIPTDDQPGAREAHVVRFMDRSLATFAKAQRPALEQALARLSEFVARRRPGTTSFAALSAADQVEVLTSLEKEVPDAFGSLHGPAVVGMFANPEYGGNFAKVGWKLIGFQDRFSWTPPFGYYDRA